MLNNLRLLVFVSAIAAAACSRAEEDLEIRGHVFDEAGKPVAGARIDFYWSANGTGRDADGTLLNLNSPENKRIFWGNVGRMEPRRAEAGASAADGSFCLALPDFSHVIMAVDHDRKRGGLLVIDRLRPKAAADIKLEPLVRVHAQFEGPSDEQPYWTHAYVLTPEYDKRPLDSRRLAHCGSFDRRFEVALPPGKYLLDAYGQSTADEDIDLRVSPDREFIVTPGSKKLDLGVLRLQPCMSLHRRIEAAKRNGKWGDYRQHYGDPPPQWHATDARGVLADVRPSDFRGKWLLVEFWGLSCRVCLKDGFPRLVRFYEQHSAQRDKFEVLAFCIDFDGELKSIADVDRALKPIVENAWGGKKLPFPIVLDSTLTTWERFGLDGLGTTILIDPDGKLVRGDEATLARILGEAKSESPAVLDTQTLRSAVARGLDVVTKAAGRYPENETCFSCHHQTLPLLAAVTARDHGVLIDEELLPAQSAFTHASFHDDLENLRQGGRIGGRAMTVGYGLWALQLAAAPTDETTEAMAAYLLKLQHDDGHWSRQTSRPPLEDSNIACTTLAIYGLENYAAESQRQAADAAIEKAARWLAEAKIESQDDRCFRLWSLALLAAPAEQIEMARKTVLAAQREDGGWAQLETIQSDAYATGQTLWVLQATGFSSTEAAYQRGANFLLSTQCDDGSWLVRSRSKPVQPYFDNGDPHGKDQFVSTPATCWAVAALAAAVK